VAGLRAMKRGAVRWCTGTRPCTTSCSGSTGTMIRMRTKQT